MLSHNTKNIHNNCETCKERLPNFELLRILAMLLVLLVHCNFFSLGHPTQEEAVNILIPTFTRCVCFPKKICHNLNVSLSERRSQTDGAVRAEPSLSVFLQSQR